MPLTGSGIVRVLYSKHPARQPLAGPRMGFSMDPRSQGKHRRDPTGHPPVITGRSARRRRLILAALSVGAAAGLAWMSVVRVGPGERAFRRTPGLGVAGPLKEGRHFVLPVVQSLVRIPEGPIRVASSVRVR